MVRSTIQRWGKTTNPLARSERLTISISRCGRAFATAFANCGPWYAVGEERFQKWKHPEDSCHDKNAAITILNVGRMNDGVEHEA